MPKCVATGATPLTENPGDKNEPGNAGHCKEVRAEVLRAFRERGAYRRIARDPAGFVIRSSHSTIHGIFVAIGMNVAEPTRVIMMACIPHADETTFPLNGKKVWAWTFRDPATENTPYAIRGSREHDIVWEVRWKTGTT